MTEYQINVYKIWYADVPDDFYIGSTKSKLSTRMADHRNKARNGNTSKIYTLMREKGVNNFEYVLVATCMVHSIDEQRQFEQQFISELKPTLNTIRAFMTGEDRKEDKKEYNNRPEVKAKKKEYYKSNHRTCICGGRYVDNTSHLTRHYNTKHHIDYVSRISN